MLTTLETRPRQAGLSPVARPARSEAARSAEEALLALGRALIDAHYRWICPTPDTQALVNARAGNERARDLRGVFGWSRPFARPLLPQPLFALMEQAGALEHCNLGDGEALFRSRVRFSSLRDTLLAHSAWPTTQADAVFFGPDTYRFAALIERVLAEQGQSLHSPDHWRETRPYTLVDLGCGTGAGGILAAGLIRHSERTRVLFTDINGEALRLAAVNARLGGLQHFECRRSDVLAAVDEPIDLVLANPPYLLDAKERAYRHGGGQLGTGLALRIVDESLQRLAPGGRLILYTAAPVVGGVDCLWQALEPRLSAAAARRGAVYDYAEIDPDVFGAELAQPGYGDVERLAVAGLSVQVR